MKKKNIVIFLIFIIFNITSFAASYNIINLDIIANLQKDGSMEVQEAITYDIGEINGIFFDIDTKGYGELRYIDIFEDVGQKNGQYQYKRVPSSKYEISLNDELYKIKLYSKNKNKVRSFLFVYSLPNAISMYDDVAQFNRKMVGENWQQSIDNISIKINVPVDKNYDSSKIFAFGHGPLTGYLDKISNSVEYNLQNYYPGDFVEAHILMEPQIFSEIEESKIIHKNMKQELLDMEKELADKANSERERADALQKYQNKIFAAKIGLWGAVMFYIHIIFKKKNKFKDLYGKYLRELPDNFSPSLAGTIMTDYPNSEEILATLLDLVRRKIVNLEEVSGKNKLVLNEKSVNLSEQEKTIIDIYFNELGDGNSVVLEDVESRYVSNNVARKFEKWQYQVLSEMNKNRLGKEGLGFIKGGIFSILGVSFFLGTMFFLQNFDNPLYIIFPFLGFTLLVSVLSVKRPNENFQKAKARWGAFKNFLTDYSQLEEAKISSIHLWEQYFVYAVAMGVSEKVVKAYKKALEVGQIKDMPTANISSYRALSLLDMYSRGTFYRSLNNTTRETYNRSMRDISKSRKSSFSGGGGGFSSGSSGGGGSRGGGGAF